MPADSIPGWAYKVLAKTDVSLKQAAWAYGCARKGSEEERLLLERLWTVIAEQRKPTPDLTAADESPFGADSGPFCKVPHCQGEPTICAAHYEMANAPSPATPAKVREKLGVAIKEAEARLKEAIDAQKEWTRSHPHYTGDSVATDWAVGGAKRHLTTLQEALAALDAMAGK